MQVEIQCLTIRANNVILVTVWFNQKLEIILIANHVNRIVLFV